MSRVKIEGNASGTGTFTIAGHNSNTDRPLNLPDAAGTVLTSVSDIESQVKTATNASGSAPIYACRAWVNFNGTGTVAIRESGNVSSVTDNGTGDYTVNFTTAMPDANYSVTSSSLAQTAESPNIRRGGTFIGVASDSTATIESGAMTTTSVTVQSTRGSTETSGGIVLDVDTFMVAIFR